MKFSYYFLLISFICACTSESFDDSFDNFFHTEKDVIKLAMKDSMDNYIFSVDTLFLLQNSFSKFSNEFRAKQDYIYESLSKKDEFETSEELSNRKRDSLKAVELKYFNMLDQFCGIEMKNEVSGKLTLQIDPRFFRYDADKKTLAFKTNNISFYIENGDRFSNVHIGRSMIPFASERNNFPCGMQVVREGQNDPDDYWYCSGALSQRYLHKTDNENINFAVIFEYEISRDKAKVFKGLLENSLLSVDIFYLMGSQRRHGMEMRFWPRIGIKKVVFKNKNSGEIISLEKEGNA